MERDDALTAAAAVAAVAGEQAEASEAGRRLAPPVVEALEASGLALLMAPTALGGAACHPRTSFDAVAAIAAADPSTAWCAAIGMGANSLLAIIDPTEAKEVLRHPARGGVGIFSPGGRLSGGGANRRLSGRWAFASNCQQHGTAAVGALLTEPDGSPRLGPDGAPVLEIAFVAGDDYDVVETWDTVGMRGTGSHDIIVEEVAVPPGRSADLNAPMWPDDPLFRLRRFDFLAPPLAAVAFGIGRAALDLAAADARHRDGQPVFGPRQPLGANVVAQHEFGRAEVRLRASRALLLESLDEAWDHARRGDAPPRPLSALVALACTEVVDGAKAAMGTATSLLSTSGVRDGSTLDRLRRDLTTMATHVIFAANLGALGRQLAGLDTVAFPHLPPD